MTDCPELASVNVSDSYLWPAEAAILVSREPVLSRKLFTVGAVSHRSLSKYKEAQELTPFTFLNPSCVLRN